MLTDFSQFVWVWAGDEIFIITAFTVAGALILAILHMVAKRARR
jgi:hypothetical protein